MGTPPMFKVIIFMLLLTLAGCSSDEELAERSCSRFTNANANQICQANELARIRAEWDTVGASMVSRPVQTSCTNIGGRDRDVQ
jgi:hypothetical protein